jgi:hypothetical protein
MTDETPQVWTGMKALNLPPSELNVIALGEK